MSCQPPKNIDLLSNLTAKKSELGAYESGEVITWCTGCGDYGVQKALERAFVLENLGIRDVVQCFDVGCNGNGSDKMNAYTIHGLHGRVISLAAGTALANTNIKVVAHGGDGGTFSEGINHLVHSVRSNYPMMFVLYNNNNYGLTTGQASSTTPKGTAMNAAPDGVSLEPMNPCQFVLNLKPTFVARSFSGDIKHMTRMFQAGLNHNGFAFVEVMQACPTYNKATPKDWYWDRLRYLDEVKDYDCSDRWGAMKAADDITENINVGILYKDDSQTPFQEKLPQRKGKKTVLVDEVRQVDIAKFIEKFR